jgi:hypothetical protein
MYRGDKFYHFDRVFLILPESRVCSTNPANPEYSYTPSFPLEFLPVPMHRLAAVKQDYATALGIPVLRARICGK